MISQLAIYNTPSDAANTAVRSFLTNVGEYYYGRKFNTGSGTGKKIWGEIKDGYFNSCCAYCGEQKEQLQIEHLIMFNRKEYGLHHPGNIVPCCKLCNKRTKLPNKEYCDWETHLKNICKLRNELAEFDFRKEKILKNFERFKYPRLNDKEKHAIRVIANSLYDNIKTESEKSLCLYKELDKAFVK